MNSRTLEFCLRIHPASEGQPWQATLEQTGADVSIEFKSAFELARHLELISALPKLQKRP